MERTDSTSFPRDVWEDRYQSLQHEIAKHIEAVAGAAEATTYVNHGNVSHRSGGPPHQLYIDMCIRDLDELHEFIKDYSRGR